ncbi:MAG: DUF6673 family protein [Pseudoflavonifractor sp.]
MLFKNIELDFDIFDAETADAYEAAVTATRDAAVKVTGETLGDAIRRQCAAVFCFFDDLFGEGFHKDLFGERTNLMECINTFREFIQAVDAQKAVLETTMQEVTAEGAAPNRAARRAAIKPAKA